MIAQRSVTDGKPRAVVRWPLKFVDKGNCVILIRYTTAAALFVSDEAISA
jgi:hypothetical protein